MSFGKHIIFPHCLDNIGAIFMPFLEGMFCTCSLVVPSRDSSHILCLKYADHLPNVYFSAVFGLVGHKCTWSKLIHKYSLRYYQFTFYNILTCL
jgi:hypothetical protein